MKRIKMINRCICFDTSFTELLVMSKMNNWTFEQLLEKTGCGSACGLCLVYIKACLETGETVFDLKKPIKK